MNTRSRDLCSVVLLCVSALACEATAQTRKPVAADEMSSIKWRDCAGHYFFLSRDISAQLGETRTPRDKQLIEMLNRLAVMAIYASEEKAGAEARDGRQPPLGRSLSDPQKGGQLKFDVDTQVSIHAARAQSEGNGPYVTRYKDKCLAPVTAFQARLLTNK